MRSVIKECQTSQSGVAPDGTFMGLPGGNKFGLRHVTGRVIRITHVNVGCFVLLTLARLKKSRRAAPSLSLSLS